MKIMLDEGAYLPERAHDDDAGLDLRTPITFSVPAHGSYVIDTGVHVELPKLTAGIIEAKSGLNVKHNIITTGVIDHGYIGSIVVKLYNLGDTDVAFSAGQKIAQLVIYPIINPNLEVVGSLTDTERGSNGFGSTGA